MSGGGGGVLGGRAVSRGSILLGADEDRFLFGSEDEDEEENEGGGGGGSGAKGDVLILSDEEGDEEGKVCTRNDDDDDDDDYDDVDGVLERQSEEIARLLKQLNTLRGGDAEPANVSSRPPRGRNADPLVGSQGTGIEGGVGVVVGDGESGGRRKGSVSGRHRSLIAAARAELGDVGDGDGPPAAAGAAAAAANERDSAGGFDVGGGIATGEVGVGTGGRPVRIRRAVVAGAGTSRTGKENGYSGDGGMSSLGITGKAVVSSGGGEQELKTSRERVRMQAPKPPSIPSPARQRPEGGGVAGVGGERVRPTYQRPAHRQPK